MMFSRVSKAFRFGYPFVFHLARSFSCLLALLNSSVPPGSSHPHSPHAPLLPSPHPSPKNTQPPKHNRPKPCETFEHSNSFLLVIEGPRPHARLRPLTPFPYQPPPPLSSPQQPSPRPQNTQKRNPHPNPCETFKHSYYWGGVWDGEAKKGGWGGG